jgi:hypothetical protein
MPAYPPRNPELEQEFFLLPFEHAAVTATTTVKVFKVPTGKTFVLDRVSYINETGLAEDAANNFAGAIKNAATTAATLFNTDSDLDPDTGASLAANTWVEGSLVSTARTFAAGEEISLVLTETGAATLPAGRGFVEGRYI